MSSRALCLTFEFIEKEFGMKSVRLMPSQTTLIPIVAYFSKTHFNALHEMSQSDREQMASWFMLANLNGHYGSSVDTRVNRDIKIIQEEPGLFHGERSFPFLEMQSAMKVRKHINLEWVQDGLERSALREANKAFVFLLYVLLVKNNADD